jgi:DNA-directed RNA polymerase subunit alpha
MTLKYGKFEIPSKIVIDERTEDNKFARFVAEPFEKGYGHTLGNALRRVLLTSIEAPAIVSIAVEGVPHEYMAIEGVVEDMINIVLNFKGALLRKVTFTDLENPREPRVMTTTLEVSKEDLDKNQGKLVITLGHLIKDQTFELVNPEHYLFTVTKPIKKQIDIRISNGRGYVPSERHNVFDRQTNEILVDSIFSPVRQVNYFVENTRVGQDTDYDRLILEVTTDGRVSPEEALSFSAQIGEMHFAVFQRAHAYKISFEEDHKQSLTDDTDILDKLCLRIDEIELSVRSTNCLSGANIETIAELVCIPDRKMLEFRNFGKKSLNEIKQKLTDMGLHLGMDLSRFGITPDNVKDKVKQLIEKKKGKKDQAKEEDDDLDGDDELEFKSPKKEALITDFEE